MTLIFRIAEECIDEFAAVEDPQLVDSLADADVADRDAELVADADHDAAFGRAVELGDRERGDLRGLREPWSRPARASPRRTGFQRCDYFLCHIALKLFDFTMNGHLLQERVVFLALQTVGGVFLVLGRDVAGHSRNTASFLFRAFENHLHSVAFLCHLSLEF